MLRLLLMACPLSSNLFGASAAGNEALQFFEEEAQVITASRRRQSARDTPLPVDVITEEEIRASGSLNLWDLLRFRVGMDVLDMNPQGFSGMGMVSVRGFPRPRSLVRQILILIDGRSVITPLRSNANWEQLQVQLQDIERIEIVRGPSAALFDSNAALGTIHIITKKPGKASMASASALGGGQGIRRAEAMGEGALKDFSYRFSHTHRAQAGTVVPSGVRANDFLFSNKGNFRGAWAPDDATSLELFAGGSWDTLGDNVVTGVPSQDRFRSHFQMLKMERSLGTNSTLEVMAARNDDTDDGDSVDIRNLQYDLDVLHRIGWGEDRMHTTWGASYRYASAESTQFFPGEPRQRNEVYRGFIHQSMKASRSLTVTLAGALEDSDTGGLEAAYQTAVLYRLTDDHRLRFAHGLAPTLPTPLDKYGAVQQGPTRKTI
ncbi:MAG: TonB-dependent receptor plug domain-containing protein, partial [Elusimicrobia bacterium]|nr:TonB-dependent receptor plug domain-containing protein [Elusimicrobiota bacterium]